MKKLIYLFLLISLFTFPQNEQIKTLVDTPKFISIKIKNNSFNRNHFVVIGDKPNGGKFSYGFPMMPYTYRKEYWTTGTKVYKVNQLGFRKLLVTIKSEDENKTVKLFNQE